MAFVLLLQTGVTVLQNAALALLVGIVMTSCWLEPAHARGLDVAPRLLRRTGRLVIGIALSMHVAALWLQSAQMAELPLSQAAAAVVPVLTSSHFGQMWLAGLVALLLLAILQWRRRPSVPLQWVGALALAGFALSRAEISHAAANADVHWPVALQALHWLLISVWTGSVLVAAWIVLPARLIKTARGRGASLAYATQLSGAATIALTGILITGSISAWRGMGETAQWIDSRWGQFLLLKLALVAMAIALGAFNRWRGLPALRDAVASVEGASRHAQRQFVLVLRAESVLLCVILVVAANLSSSVPPMVG